MATFLFLRNARADTHLGTNAAKADGTSAGWGATYALGTSRGASLVSSSSDTVTGTTLGVEIGQAGGNTPDHWISPPVSADVTISGTITCNVWMLESNMSANMDAQVILDVIRANTGSIVQIANAEENVELGTTIARRVWTATPTSTTVNRGDRLRVRVLGNDQTTMVSGFSFTLDFGGTTVNEDGDSFLQFSEDFSFESAPSGTTLYLTDTASDVSTSSVDREAWTSRGGSASNDVTNTSAGWTSGIQVTDTAGGTAVDWFTPGLEAFTLQGMAQANIRALGSSAGTDTSLRVELARVDNDGTNSTVWGSWCLDLANDPAGQVGTTERAEVAYVSGDSLAFTDGQRVRIRIYLDDASNVAMGAGHTVTTYYNGPTGGASGDSWVTLPQTVTEFGGGGSTYTKAGFGRESL